MLCGITVLTVSNNESNKSKCCPALPGTWFPANDGTHAEPLVFLFILEMTLAVVKLPQLPLLLLVKFVRVHESCAWASAATAVVVRHRVAEYAICCCGLSHVIPVLISLCSTTINWNAPFRSSVAFTASIYL